VNLLERRLWRKSFRVCSLVPPFVPFTNNGAATAVANRLYKIVQDLTYDNGQLYYMLKRNFSADLFPNISPQLGPVIDAYQGGNAFIENLMASVDNDSVAEIAVQSGFDLVNQAAPMSALYNTWTGIGNTIYSRSLTARHRSNGTILGQSCDPCMSICGSRSNREAWVAPIYSNGRGFGLMSGNFRHGYVNDQYAMGFGVDQVQGGLRLGVMGVGGWSKLQSTGSLAKTWNETSFGGVYAYSNVRNGNTDFLFSAGWLGMDNDIRQRTVGGNLTGNMDSGMASVSAILTQTYNLDGLQVLPSFGVEYGYYYQSKLDVAWSGQTAFRNAKSHANLVALPIGVTFKREMRTASGGLLLPEFRARYIANVGMVRSQYGVMLPGSPTSALMTTRMTDRHAGDIGLGMGFTRGWTTLRGDYGYMFSQHHGDQYVSVTGSWKF